MVEPITSLEGIASKPNPAALFVAEYQHQTVAILNSAYKKIGAVHYPAGTIAVDSYGDLYVGNNGGHGKTINVYAPPYKTPKTIAVSTTESVGEIAVDPVSGVLAVPLLTSSGNPPQVLFYKRGATTPCAAVVDANLEQNGGPAQFDGEGNLFFIGYTQDGGTLASISGECKATSAQVYNLTGLLGRIEFDSNENLVLQMVGGPINVYAHPANGVVGQPIATVPLNPFKGIVPSLLSMSSDGEHIWAADCCGKGPTSVELYDYPSGGNPVLTVNGLPEPAEAAPFPVLVP